MYEQEIYLKFSKSIRCQKYVFSLQIFKVETKFIMFTGKSGFFAYLPSLVKIVILRGTAFSPTAFQYETCMRRISRLCSC